ncbi:MAG: UDP-2,3-diacylglucosamine diphosphatase [Bacteroidales bacterium]
MAGNIYFASDFHLGLPAGSDPKEREKRVVAWLDKISPTAAEIYLLGDVFDFWWEYRRVVPKGFTRFLGKVSELTDSGLPVHFFTGNHDMWVGNYLRDECGMVIHTGPVIREFSGKKFYLAHGEGLGSKDPGYKILLSIFHNKPLRALYSAIHPAIGMWIGHKWSLGSRLGKGMSPGFMGEDKEDLFRHSLVVLESENIDYFIYGHRHLPMSVKIGNNSVITILGDWIRDASYVEWNGNELKLVQNF